MSMNQIAQQLFRDVFAPPEGAWTVQMSYRPDSAPDYRWSCTIFTEEGGGWCETGMGATPDEAKANTARSFAARLEAARQPHAHSSYMLHYRDGKPVRLCRVCGINMPLELGDPGYEAAAVQEVVA